MPDGAPPRILVTGAGGLLGPYLVEAARGREAVVVGTALRTGDHPCDLTDHAAVKALLTKVTPAIVIHTAAFTDVDGCERDPDKARALNCTAVANLAELLPPSARLVAVSTDQVYPDTAGLHAEGTEAPVNAYGRSKLDGERAALARSGSVALRTNFFGPSRTPGRQSLSDFVANGLRDRKPMTWFEDVSFSPLHVETLADLLVRIALGTLEGAYNLGSREGFSKAEFGFAIAHHHGLATDLVKRGVSTELPARAPRPRDLRMNVVRIEAALGQKMPTLAHEIARLAPVS